MLQLYRQLSELCFHPSPPSAHRLPALMHFLSSSLDIAQRQLCDSNVQKNDRFLSAVFAYKNVSLIGRDMK
jgi:hypothetical protein